MTMEDYRAKARQHIDQYGRSVTGVFADPRDGTPAFSYTIGNSLAGVPELLLLGLAGKDATWLLNAVSEALRKEPLGRDIAHRYIPLGGSHPVKVRRVARSSVVRSEWTIQAGQILGNERYEVMQVVMPDPFGRWPEDADCAEAYRLPLL